ncbi:hypothetical protein EX895_003709 [Sporisorium graminicola]|uniref:RRM domain-containing protein n=1 Tax=Sporisorium graminicola TaxID=280036 RepID=A0A4U7KVS8_9BASI|nr:hypothetical protein EX895_003709 [Sporisorium graminicola]TKY87032.1 hypothetical protein EX895_003709 [Sporisorium graminicola]
MASSNNARSPAHHHKSPAAPMSDASQNHAGLRPPSAGVPLRTPSQASSHRSGSRASAAPSVAVRPAFSSSEPPYVIDGPGGRIACVADVRGNLSLFNQIAAETRAQVIIHTGDFGFYDNNSLDRISDRTLRHLVQYSTLIDPVLRSKLLAADPPRGPAATEKGASAASMRQHIAQHQHQHHHGSFLSEFSDLLAGKIKLQVPVFTVWGACEDVAILERFRTGEYQVNNLHVLDEATTKAIEVGGIRLRLFGLGGAVVLHKLFDNGDGAATIAGGQGTMWTTALQIGELVDTAQKTFDPTETRLLVTHASPGREGILAQLALAIKADLTVSAGLHFRYGVSYNEFSVQHDAENYRNKLQHAKHAFGEIWDTVKTQVDAVIDENQRMLLNNALAVANRVAPTATATGAASEEPAWKNTWNWNLPDAAYGNLVLSIKDGRVSAETKSQGFNFAYRRSGQPMSAVTPTAVPGGSTTPTAASAAVPAAKNAIPAAAAAAVPATQRNNAAPASASTTTPAKAGNAKSSDQLANGAAAAPAGASSAAPAGKPVSSANATAGSASLTKPIKEKKERPARAERGHESAASRSDFDGGFTSGTDGRKSPSGPRKQRNPYTLYVSQLKEALPVTEDELRTYFGPAAAGISGIKLVFDKPHRRGVSSGKEDAAAAAEVQRRQRPFAYVEFKDEAAMQAGLERQGEVLKGDIKPALEQADSNKATQPQKPEGEAGSVEKVEKADKAERARGRKSGGAGAETDKDEETGKSGDEKAGRGGKVKKERGAPKEKPDRADKGEKGGEKNTAAAAAVEEAAGATDGNATSANSHNKNKKKSNARDKRDKRDKGAAAGMGAADKEKEKKEDKVGATDTSAATGAADAAGAGAEAKKDVSAPVAAASGEAADTA